MTSIQACTCASACRADRVCDRLPCFQAHLDAAQGTQHRRIHLRTEACASHLGTMVAALATWAREKDLADAELTILIIEVVKAIILGCGGGEDDLSSFASAWRRIASGRAGTPSFMSAPVAAP